MDFKTNEGVAQIFQSINCIGNQNCFFITQKDYRKTVPTTSMIFGGPVGVFADSATKAMEEEQKNDYSRFEALLINQTERGLAIIPLASEHGIQLTPNLSKMTPQLDKAVFVPNERINSIEMKRFNILKNKTKTIDIVLNGGLPTIHQIANIKEKDVPYHEANFANFMAKYEK